MPILCRPAREEDLERTDELVVTSINDLTQRHGFGKPAFAIATTSRRLSCMERPRPRQPDRSPAFRPQTSKTSS